MSGRVEVGFCHPGLVTGAFCVSVAQAVMHCQNIVRLTAEHSGPLVHAGRNTITERFVHGDADWLWMLDADISFMPDALERLLSVAHPDLRPIVGGLYFSGGMSAPTEPVMYRNSPSEDCPNGLSVVHDWERGEVVDVDSMGAGCMLIHRSVIVAMHKKYSHLPSPWFSTSFDGAECGEDIGFCKRASALGFPLLVHTGVALGHIKPTVLDEASYDAERYAQLCWMATALEEGSMPWAGSS